MTRFCRFFTSDVDTTIDVAEMTDAQLIAHLQEKMDTTRPNVTSYTTYQKRGKYWEDAEHPISKPYLVSIGSFFIKSSDRISLIDCILQQLFYSTCITVYCF